MGLGKVGVGARGDKGRLPNEGCMQDKRVLR